MFHLVEVGAGDGLLAQSIVDAVRHTEPRFAQALRYVAADYQPGTPDPMLDIQRVKAAGVRALRNIVGCILCNELIDNFPVHRFVVQDGRVKEIFVTLSAGKLTEALDEPSTPGIAERLASLGLFLPEGYRGEVNLALADWGDQLAGALERGFVLTVDYGERAADLYAPQNAAGTLVCYRRHVASGDPYQHIGKQDITGLVDFTSLMQAGEGRGLATVGYARQREFLTNLGFYPLLEALPAPGRSAARTELSRLAMLTLVDPDDYGDFKVLAQAKGVGANIELMGFGPGDGA